jgi:hypothetical protein
MNPRLSLSPKHDKMPIRVTSLAFDLFVLHYSSSKNSGKVGDRASLIVYVTSKGSPPGYIRKKDGTYGTLRSWDISSEGRMTQRKRAGMVRGCASKQPS